GPELHTGIGRYTKNLLIALSQSKKFSDYNFTLLVYPELIDEIKRDLGQNFNYVSTDIRHYSFAEQIKMPFLLNRLHPDLVHFTHFNKPLFYFGLSVVTIHDLIKHFYRGQDTTTRKPLLYWFKYFGYLLLTQVIIKTNHLIVPSDYWRQYIINHFHLESGRITTTHEAIDPKFLSMTPTKLFPPQNYLLYTGNLYPHKNIGVILRALKQIPDLQLKIICARNLFQKKLIEQIKQLKLESQVEFLGFVKDQKFVDIYKQALCLVHPAFMEGFSLTGLEAMALNCPVIASNSSCLPEIYHDAVLYFNPKMETELVNQINRLRQDPKLRISLITKGKKLIKLYSWSKTATQTLQVYSELL
ncbi:MAG: glycosyltransferase family 1 protein, partial [Candidatus Shapirobacteria bacterium]|nr:glycosyltransferase family 1 protein [Candidatus Shapirobacteria bacterium]